MAPMGKKSYLQVAPFDPDVSRRWFRNTLAHIRLSRTDENTRATTEDLGAALILARDAADKASGLVRISRLSQHSVRQFLKLRTRR
jgi:hypothetical protein